MESCVSSITSYVTALGLCRFLNTSCVSALWAAQLISIRVCNLRARPLGDMLLRDTGLGRSGGALSPFVNGEHLQMMCGPWRRSYISLGHRISSGCVIPCYTGLCWVHMAIYVMLFLYTKIKVQYSVLTAYSQLSLGRVACNFNSEIERKGFDLSYE